MTYDLAKLARMEAELEGKTAALRGLSAAARDEDMEVQRHMGDVQRTSKIAADNWTSAGIAALPADYLKAHGVHMPTVNAAAAAQTRAAALRAQAETLQDPRNALSLLVVACRKWALEQTA